MFIFSSISLFAEDEYEEENVAEITVEEEDGDDRDREDADDGYILLQ